MQSNASKKQFVEELKEKDQVQSVFMASDKMLLKDRNGKSYMTVNLKDASGSINGRLWDRAEELAQEFQAGDFVFVKGHVQVYQSRRQMVIHTMSKANASDFDLKDFVSSSLRDPKVMFAELMELVDRMENTHIKQLTQDVLNDPEIQGKFLKCPAAKTIHHAYMGGLLEHVLSISQIMVFMAKHYQELNFDLLLFGAIFHDIGKVWELDVSNGIHYTDRGRLVGHMALACELVDKKAARILGFSEELKDILKHIILSHHGKLEYGSPKRPKFPEAMMVAMIDDLDSKLNTLQNFMKGEAENSDGWTQYQPQFDRYFFLKIPELLGKD